MKLKLLFVFVLFFCLKINSQIEVKKFKGNINNYTLYLGIGDTSEEDTKSFMNKARGLWKISKLEFYEKSDNPHWAEILGDNRNAILTGILQETKTVTSTNTQTHMVSSTDYIHWYYRLIKPVNIEVDENSSFNYTEEEVAKVALFDPRTAEDNNSYFNTLNQGLILNYLSIIQECLTNQVVTGLYRSKIKLRTAELSNLKTKSLYVPEYTFKHYEKFTGTYTDGDEEGIMKDYGFKYKKISEDALENKILNTEKDFYYMIYVRSCTDKYIMVINGNTGALLYTIYKPLSYKLSAKDLKKIKKAIDKS